MRDVDTINRELSLRATTRAALRDMGCTLATRQVDELLDERIAVDACRSPNSLGGLTGSPTSPMARR